MVLEGTDLRGRLTSTNFGDRKVLERLITVKDVKNKLGTVQKGSVDTVSGDVNITTPILLS